MKQKFIVTSGCSFSDRENNTWPTALADRVDATVINYGLSSAGNSWISKTAIHGTQLLLDNNISADDILVIVMWSGIDRKDLFVSRSQTPGFNELISGEGSNPVNFLDQSVNEYYKSSTTDGYLVGNVHSFFVNKKIQDTKRELIMKFYPDEALAIESYENFLRVQWYCQSKKIKLLNLTYLDIMHYPAAWHQEPKTTITADLFRNVRPLYNMIEFGNWLFWKDTQGLYEYARDNGLFFCSDGQHLDQVSHAHYVENFLIPKLVDSGYL